MFADRLNRDGLWIAALGGTLLSLAATGFVFGHNNNVFHLPIVAGLYDEPQFANDAFIQSLRHYAAGPWILLAGSVKYIDPYWSFLALFAAGRFLAIAGFLACARLVGIDRLSHQLVFALLIATTHLLRGGSMAGDGGLFINYFTHSELANGLFLFALAFAIQRRIAATLAITGLIFFVNAFFGVWTAFVAGIVLLVQVARGEIVWRRIVLEGTIGTMFAVMLAAPVIWAVLANPEFGRPAGFDYPAFLNEYYPIHFLFGSVGLAGKLGLALVVTTAFGAFFLLGKAGRPWLVALGAACALYGIGVAVSYTTHSAAILNLHLLRSSTLIHLLAAFGLAALATRWIFDNDTSIAALAAPALIVLLALPVDGRLRYPALAMLALFVILAVAQPVFRTLLQRAPDSLLARERALKIAAIAFVIAAVPVLAVSNGAKNRTLQNWADEWSQLGAWARQTTPQQAAFLIPHAKFKSEAGLSDVDTGEMMSTVFEYAARRPAWIDFKRGAAAMWSPSYYSTWHQRVAEADALTSHRQRLAYARENNIAYIVEVCLRDREANVAFTTGRLCAYPATASAALAASR